VQSVDNLQEKHRKKIANTSTLFVRSIMDTIHWDSRLVGLKGARGVGKVTLLLQYVKKNYPLDASTLSITLPGVTLRSVIFNKTFKKWITDKIRIICFVNYPTIH